MSNIYNLQADLDLKDNVLISISCKQLDDLELELDIWNNGEETDLSNYSCRLTAIKIDGVPFIQDTAYTIVKNKVKIQCERQLTAMQGITKADLIFIDKATKKQKHSFDLDIIVKPSVLSRGGEISKPTLTLLEQIDKKLDEIENIGQVLDEAKKTRDDLIVKTNTANESEKNLIQTTTAADNKKKEVEGTISNASKKITEVNTSIDNANNTKKSLISTATEKAQELKETADIEKQAIINTADTKKGEINKIIANADTKKGELENTLTVTTTKKEQLDSANVQATKNIETLNSFGDATDLTKKVNTLENKVLKNELTPLKTDSVLTKLPNCAGGYVRNMQIRGKTLQNVKLSTGYFEKTFPSGTHSSFYNFFLQKNEMLAKPNTEYTIIIDFESVINEGEIGFGNTHYELDPSYFTSTINIPANSLGRKIFKLTTKSDLSQAKVAMRNFCNIPTDNTTAKGTLKFRYMILEGDYTNKEIPEYFEGIKSVGEAEDNKISILTKSKNLLDTNNDVKVLLNSNGYCSWDGHKLVVNSGDKAVQYMTCYFKVKLYQGINYKLNYKNNIISGIRMCDIKTIDDKYISKGDAGIKFSVPKTDYYKIIFYCTADKAVQGNTEYTDITLVANNDDASYVEPKTDKTEILLGDKPLMGLSDEVGDIVDFDKSELTRNVGKVVLNGSEDWEYFSTPTSSTTQGFKLKNLNIIDKLIPCICDKIPSFNQPDWYKLDDTGISASYGAIYLKFKNVKGIEGMKSVLKENPVTVYYQSTNPVIEKLNIKDTLQTFQDGYIQLDNAITPTTSLEYSTNLPSALGGLTQITDKLVDDVTNVEITISDMDAEIGEARKGKTTLEERLEDDRTNILNKFNEYGKKDGTLQTGLNAEMLVGITQDKLMKSYSLNSVNIDTLCLENYIVNISENDVAKYGTKPLSTSWISVTNTWGGHFIRQTASTCNNTKDNPRMWVRTRYMDSKSMWSEWKELASTENFTPILLNGWKFNYSSTNITKSGNSVIVNLRIKDGNVSNSTVLITGIPFKPVGGMFFPAYDRDGNLIGQVGLYENGELQITKGFTHNKDIILNLAYTVI